MSRKVDVSIIIPVYNGQDVIADAIGSCLTQTFENIEIIVIDNCSTDDTGVVVKKFCDNDNRVKYIFSEKRGRSLARNIGIDMAKGKYIQFLDADDLIKPTKISESLALFCHSPKIDAVQTSTDYTTKGRIIKTTLPYQKNDYWADLCLRNTIPINSMIIKKSICKKFTEGVDYCEDWNFWLRSLCGSKIGYINESLAVVNVHGNNTMSDFDKMKIYEIWNYLQFFDKKIGFVRSIKRMIFITGDLSIYIDNNLRIKSLDDLIDSSVMIKFVFNFLKLFKLYKLLSFIYRKRFSKGLYANA